MVRMLLLTEAPLSDRVLYGGHTYTLGRKEGAVDLLVPVGRLSRHTGTIHVTSVAPAQVHEPEVRAKVTWTMQMGSKAGGMIETWRDRNRVEQRIRVDTPYPLEDGARIRLVAGVYAELRWIPCVVQLVRTPSLDTPEVRQAAATAGVHLVTMASGLHPAATHICVAHVRPNKTQLLALVQGLPLVSTAFVAQVCECRPMSCPYTFPDVLTYTPPSDPSLHRDEQIPSELLAPRPERAHVLAHCVLLFWVPTLERMYMDMADLAQAAGAHVDMLEVVSTWTPDEKQRALLRQREALPATVASWPIYWMGVELPSQAASWATSLRIQYLPQGLAAITQSILEVRPLTSALPQSNQPRPEAWPVPAATSRPSPERVVDPSIAEMSTTTIEGGGSDTSLGPGDTWSSIDVTEASLALHPPTAPPSNDTGISSAPAASTSASEGAPDRLRRTPRVTADELLGMAEDRSPLPPPPPSPSPPPTAAILPPAPAAANLPRRAGGRRSALLDELLGIDRPPPPPPPPASPSPPPRESAKYRSLLPRATPPTVSEIPPPSSPAWDRLTRPSFLQVRTMPLVRRAPSTGLPNYKKFRRTQTTARPHRVALVPDYAVRSDAALFLGDEDDAA